jgi:exosortase D (VPLPA-CTERM-specific)
MFNIPVFLEGNVIDLGVYQLQVVEACSGLRYLFPLMSLGFIAAYFYQAAFWKKAVVFLATIPVTIFMNSFRIGAIGVMVDNWGISMAEGFLHDFEGWIIFMACAVILLALIWVMERITTKRPSFAAVFGVEDEPTANIISNDSSKGSMLPLYFAIIILTVSLFLTQALDSRVEQPPEHKAFINFPMEIKGGWKGKHDKLDDAVLGKLGMTDYLLANYQKDKFTAVNFYVAYYASQRKGTSPHSPRVCIPGGGWEIFSFTRTAVGEHPVNRVIVKKGKQRQLVYYWFQGHGRIVANEYLNKWYLFQDAIFKNRTDGSLVRLVTNLGEHEPIELGDQRLIDFMNGVTPELKKYILD